jgi:hypothetical protein
VRMRTLTMSTRRHKRSNAVVSLFGTPSKYLLNTIICRPSVDCPADFVTCSTPMSRSPGLSGRVELHFTLVRARADKRLDDLVQQREQRALEKKVPEPSRQTEVHRFVCVRYPSSFALGSTLGASCAAKNQWSNRRMVPMVKQAVKHGPAYNCAPGDFDKKQFWPAVKGTSERIRWCEKHRCRRH